ncbi:hypothetical protein GCM10010324_03180 [Streptomyces hiroshimensis]|uniref:Uncharacterized protein n=1 Tax=Streptomyces hiroshimensis TaxID=66424 RepID=A0ABQ2Y4N7_9ACTN|nr:hypothetical protein GCM10010324_03180 [Streptomyces hiroshimensis]
MAERPGRGHGKVGGKPDEIGEDSRKDYGNGRETAGSSPDKGRVRGNARNSAGVHDPVRQLSESVQRVSALRKQKPH